MMIATQARETWLSSQNPITKKGSEKKRMKSANKTLVITGTSRGLGRARVHEALRQGARRVSVRRYP
jgi:hypothetical protein